MDPFTCRKQCTPTMGCPRCLYRNGSWKTPLVLSKQGENKRTLPNFSVPVSDTSANTLVPENNQTDKLGIISIKKKKRDFLFCLKSLYHGIWLKCLYWNFSSAGKAVLDRAHLTEEWIHWGRSCYRMFRHFTGKQKCLWQKDRCCAMC